MIKIVSLKIIIKIIIPLTLYLAHIIAKNLALKPKTIKHTIFKAPFKSLSLSNLTPNETKEESISFMSSIKSANTFILLMNLWMYKWIELSLAEKSHFTNELELIIQIHYYDSESWKSNSLHHHIENRTQSFQPCHPYPPPFPSGKNRMMGTTQPQLPH